MVLDIRFEWFLEKQKNKRSLSVKAYCGDIKRLGA